MITLTLDLEDACLGTLMEETAEDELLSREEAQTLYQTLLQETS